MANTQPPMCSEDICENVPNHTLMKNIWNFLSVPCTRNGTNKSIIEEYLFTDKQMEQRDLRRWQPLRAKVWKYLICENVLDEYLMPKETAQQKAKRLIDINRSREYRRQIKEANLKKERQKQQFRNALSNKDVWNKVRILADKFSQHDIELLVSSSPWLRRELAGRKASLSKIVSCHGLTNQEIMNILQEAKIPHFWLE
jgi:hypothetical protein